MRDDPLIPVSQRCAGRVSGAFLSAIDAALAVHEGDRPQSVEAWQAAMANGRQGRARAGDERNAAPSKKKEKAKGKPKSARAKWFAVILGVVALLIMGGIAIQEQAALEKKQTGTAGRAGRSNGWNKPRWKSKQQEQQAALEKQAAGTAGRVGKTSSRNSRRHWQRSVEEQQAALEKQRLRTDRRH